MSKMLSHSKTSNEQNVERKYLFVKSGKQEALSCRVVPISQGKATSHCQMKPSNIGSGHCSDLFPISFSRLCMRCSHFC